MLLLMSRPRSTTQGWHRRLIQCVRQYRYNIAGLTPRYLAMSLPVCPSAFIRFAVAVCSVSSMRWMAAGVGGHHESR